MSALPAVTGFVIVAAITPGPNNFIVMAAAVRGGARAAVPAIAGVVLGSLGLLLLVWMGTGAALGNAPGLRRLLAIAGGLYLAWLGVRIIWGSKRSANEPNPPRLPNTMLGLAAFQFLNPKSWVMIGTATAATVSSLGSLGAVATILIVVTIPCLILWAMAGSALAGLLERPVTRRWFDWGMGGLLVASAVLLVGAV